MRKEILTMFLAGSLFWAGPAVSAEEYLMSPGDKLHITVAGDADLSSSEAPTSEYTVRPDGKVSFPLIGEIDSKGMTISDFTQVLEQRLSEYLLQPQVTVNITALGTTRVYVFGEVNKPGLYELTKAHRVLDAVGMANGFTKDAAKKKVFLVRSGKTGEATKVNLNDIITKGDLSQNYVLGEGDLLYLTSNGRIDFARDIMPLISGAYIVSEINDNN